MAKITVKVCYGTTCFVMGTAHLQELQDIIPEKYGDSVEILGNPCMDLCHKDWEYARAPYVKVGEDVVYEATVDKVLNLIEEKLNNV